jgi:ATP-binding cassette subfamily F protein 3
LLQHANFLVLDEPTNHLDISARESLEVMLSGFNGTILFVSHDRYFIDRLATRIWAIDEAKIQAYLGNYTDYQRQLGHRAEKEPEPKPQQEEKAPALPVSRSSQDAKLQKSLTQAERDIARLEGKLNEISDALTVASIDEDIDGVARLGVEYERAQAELEGAYAAWEELTGQLETMAGPAPTH